MNGSTFLSYWTIGFGYALLYITPYISELCLFLLSLFQIRYYLILGERDSIRKTLKILERESYTFSSKYMYGKDIPTGYFFGFKCAGYIDNKHSYDDQDKIYMLTTSKFYKDIITKQETVEMPSFSVKNTDTENEPISSAKERTKISVYTRHGQYISFFYKFIQLDVSHIEPIGDQKEIVENIVSLFQKNGRATVFIHGVSLAGKSSIGLLVAKALKGGFCHTFNPSDPGDSFCSMIDDIRSRDNENPIVVTLEEANVIIHNIHTNSIPVNPKIPTSVRDKASWSTLLDDMIFYKNIVFILTSNESKEELDALDQAYLRKGRINASYEMLKQLPLDDV